MDRPYTGFDDLVHWSMVDHTASDGANGAARHGYSGRVHRDGKLRCGEVMRGHKRAAHDTANPMHGLAAARSGQN
jgi:hypothetical protein